MPILLLLQNCASLNCTQISCEIGELQPEEYVLVQVFSRLWLNTFVDDASHTEDEDAGSLAFAQITSLPFAPQFKPPPQALAVFTKLNPIDPEATTDVPWWLILLAILIALLILALIIYACYRVSAAWHERHGHLCTFCRRASSSATDPTMRRPNSTRVTPTTITERRRVTLVHVPIARLFALSTSRVFSAIRLPSHRARTSSPRPRPPVFVPFTRARVASVRVYRSPLYGSPQSFTAIWCNRDVAIARRSLCFLAVCVPLSLSLSLSRSLSHPISALSQPRAAISSLFVSHTSRARFYFFYFDKYCAH